MVREPRGIAGIMAAATVAAVINFPTHAHAFTSAEGAVIGDQGFYWFTPAETWVFPHRIGNIDNRVLVQYAGAPSTFLGGDAPWYNVTGHVARLPSGLLTVDSAQTGLGGGIILEVLEGLNVGLWLSGYNPGLDSFVSNGVSATRFTTYVGDGTGPGSETAGLSDAEAYLDTLDAGRKLDVFTSYWLPDLGVEAGLHLWWGSNHNALELDDSAGTIDIDSDSDPTTGDSLGIDSTDDMLSVDKSSFSMSDLGVGLGAGYGGLEGLHADLGFDFNMLGVSWKPNGLKKYADIGGIGFGVNMRGHFDLSDTLTVGGFARYSAQSLGFEPQRQRDGGDLPDMWDPTDPDQQGSLPDPQTQVPTADPASANNEATTGPVSGLKYEEKSSDMQVAGLVKVKPNSRATVYVALGWSRIAHTEKASIGSDWYAERATRAMSLPFVNLGFEGTVFSWLNLYVGAYKRWEGTKSTIDAKDDRIPNNGDAQGAAGAATGAGQGDNTNKNRREYKETVLDRDTSRTRLILGTRIHHGPVQLVGHLDPGFLLRGVNFISGASGDLNLWVSLIYDWDYDTDTETGNGTMMYSPHSPEPAAPPAPASPPAESPPVEEEFES